MHKSPTLHRQTCYLGRDTKHLCRISFCHASAFGTTTTTTTGGPRAHHYYSIFLPSFHLACSVRIRLPFLFRTASPLFHRSMLPLADQQRIHTEGKLNRNELPSTRAFCSILLSFGASSI